MNLLNTLLKSCFEPTIIFNQDGKIINFNSSAAETIDNSLNKLKKNSSLNDHLDIESFLTVLDNAKTTLQPQLLKISIKQPLQIGQLRVQLQAIKTSINYSIYKSKITYIAKQEETNDDLYLLTINKSNDTKEQDSLLEYIPVSLWLQDFSEIKQRIMFYKKHGINDLEEFFKKNPKKITKIISKSKSIEANKATLKLYNAKNIEELLTNRQKILAKESLPSVIKELLLCAEGQTSSIHPTEISLYTIDGIKKEAMLHWSVLPGYEKSWEKILIATIDISKRKSLESKMLQSQKLESLGLLAGGIAHDFNNLLAGIMGNADFALTESQAGTPLHDCILDVQEAAKRAAILSKQMLAYSGKGHFVVKSLSLNTATTSMLHLLSTTISKKIKLSTNLSHNLPLIDADITQIRQIIMTLVTNASESLMNKTGQIEISTYAQHCNKKYLDELFLHEELQEGSYVAIRIKDNGCGIKKEDINKIFDPFFTTKFTGRGLGLAAVLGIMRGHKGAIKVTSTPEKGSCFTMLFPWSKNQQKSIPVALTKTSKIINNENSWQGAGTILIVDDEQIIRTVASRFLKKIGFNIISVSNGREAIAIFQQEHKNIQLTLLDLNMPHMSGNETFQEMLKIDPNAKVILSSGYDEEIIAETFKNADKLAAFLQKPYHSKELKELVQTLLIDNKEEKEEEEK